MSVKVVNPGNTAVSVNAGAEASIMPPFVADIPGGLYPLKMSVYELDEWRMLNGWPMPIPAQDIKAHTLISCEGEVLANREDPASIQTEALVRWVSDDSFYDVTDLQWRPVQQGLPLVWSTSPAYAPTLINDYRYEINDEVFIRDAINFDSDTRDHFWMNTGGQFPASGYTMIAVLSPNSAYGNDAEVPYNGIWGYGEEPPGDDVFTEEPTGGYMNLTFEGSTCYLSSDQSEKQRGPGLAQFQSSSRPMFLAVVFKRPQAVIYAGHAPTNLKSFSVNTGSVNTTLDPHIVLGRSMGDVLHTADMALFDIGIYSDALSRSAVVSEISKLAQTYGGDK